MGRLGRLVKVGSTGLLLAEPVRMVVLLNAFNVGLDNGADVENLDVFSDGVVLT